MGIVQRQGGRILVIGHLFLDYFVDSVTGSVLPRPKAGGTAFNAAIAFKARGFSPIVVGKVGKDRDGARLRASLRRCRLDMLLGEDPARPTGRCYIHSTRLRDDTKRLVVNRDNANCYGLEFLEDAVARAEVEQGDLAFVAAHFIAAHTMAESRALFEMLSDRGLIVILDLVPHSLHRQVSADQLAAIIGDRVRVLISELSTLQLLMRAPVSPGRIPWTRLMRRFRVSLIVARFGFEDISRQIVRKRTRASASVSLDVLADTGYADLPTELRRGHGDRLTADILARFLSEIKS